MYKISDGWMVFNGRFNEPLSNVVFPIGIQKIRFGVYFNQDDSQLPNSLTHLSFGDYFDQDVSKLPDSLTHLTFGWAFNQDVSNLPNSITHLTFGKNFNQDVSKLPNSITHLTLRGYFNQDISKLPNNLTHLKLCVFSNYKFLHNLNPYLYHLTSFDITNMHKHKAIMLERCQINKHNISIREDKLIDLLLKN